MKYGVSFMSEIPHIISQPKGALTEMIHPGNCLRFTRINQRLQELYKS